MPQYGIRTISQNPGGIKSKLNITAAGQVKDGKGTIRRVHVIAAGSGGNLTINDLATGGTPAAANQAVVIPNATLVAGADLTLDIPVVNGIQISAVPAGSPQLVLSYD